MLLGILTEVRMPFAYGAVTLYGWPSHAILLDSGLVTSSSYYESLCESHNTDAATLVRLARHRFGLVPVRSPLLGESSFLSSPAGT